MRKLAIAAQNVLCFLEIPSFKVCFCFQYPDGTDRFDSLERNLETQLSDKYHVASKRHTEGSTKPREIKHRHQLSQLG